MRTRSIQGPRRVWRAACLALSGATAVLTIGALGVLGASPAQAGDDQGPLVLVFVQQPTTTQVDVAVTPTVEVKVENLNGQQDWDYNGPVVLKYAVNRLGAPEPTGNQANAYDGLAKFPGLTFSAVGFGFELVAEIPGQSEEPPPWPSGWSWIPGQGGGMSNGISKPSAPFDIVGELVQCGESESPSAGPDEHLAFSDEDLCQTETVSSDGTSGSATAPNEPGTLAATGGGFPRLSCTAFGGVVSFSSTLSKTITVSFAGSLGEQYWDKSVNICWGSPTPFITKSGFPALFNPINDEFEGLLPHCSAYRPAPCVSSVWSGSWGSSVKATIQAPVGDPHMTFE